MSLTPLTVSQVMRPTGDKRRRPSALGRERVMDQRGVVFMFYGLSSAWLLLVLFAVSLVMRERKIVEEIKRLKSLIEDRERK